MIEQGIYKYLTGIPAITGLVGKDIFEQAFPKDTEPPLVVYFSVTSTPVYTLQGEEGLQIRRFQFDCYSNIAREARTLQNAVRTAFANVATGVTFPDGSVLQQSRIVLDFDKQIEPGPGGTLFCSVLDVELSFVPSA